MHRPRSQQWLTVGFGVAIATLLGTALLARNAIVDRVYPPGQVENEGEAYAYLNGLLVAIAEAEVSHQSYLDTAEANALERYNTKLEIVNGYLDELKAEHEAVEQEAVFEEALVYREALERLRAATETHVEILEEGIEQYKVGQLDLLTRLEIAQQSSEARVDAHLALQALLDEGSVERQWEMADTTVSINNELWLMGLVAGLGSIVLGILYGWLMQTLTQYQKIASLRQHETEHLTAELQAKTADLQTTKEILTTELNRRQEIETTYKEIEQAKELTDLKLNFFSLASHELRTPLSAILVSAQLLDNQNVAWSEAKRSRNLRRIQSAAKTMAQLLSDILLLTRAEAGKLEFNPQLVELKDFCQQLVGEVKFNTQSQHYIMVEQQGACDEAYLDERLLRAMLMSLLTNAIKYSPPESEIQLMIFGEQGHTRFQVSDQGIGVPADDQQHLFDSFHRGQNVKSFSGTGLGLAVVKKCLELHGGKIEVESQVGVGTTFLVDMPWVETVA
ncbi:sensor histidine kinase [Leptothoe spongobia]|uniref:histidine kinase n=1 Tax=Leptothoe spongobia TAU-MAC 1115 TaxID=1967444 RepID=A0A947DFR0_9CYAN|nr:ATP-binding protein [Leptothoe spongobia]MBT9315081.1 histidine kinase [Leptothoe spongobia TAU-MAC 1115]